MIYVQNSLAVFLIALGLATMLVGSFGIIRLPDFFTRTHAASKVDTVGIIFLLAGLAVYEGFTLNGGKLVLTIVFVALTNPVAIHILARSAIRFGLKPWRRNEREEEGGRA
jgi:multicomponent Na+:H+ antiporter subunit G